MGRYADDSIDESAEPQDEAEQEAAMQALQEQWERENTGKEREMLLPDLCYWPKDGTPLPTCCAYAQSLGMQQARCTLCHFPDCCCPCQWVECSHEQVRADVRVCDECSQCEDCCECQHCSQCRETVPAETIHARCGVCQGCCECEEAEETPWTPKWFSLPPTAQSESPQADEEMPS